VEKKDWVWMPHPGHLIVARDCRFHLNTYVGGYIVSTVGEYIPDAPVREILAECRGIKLEGLGDARLADYMEKIGYQEIGLDRLYETMVFKADSKKEGCCPYRVSEYSEEDIEGYNDAKAAFKGHMKLCEKWSNESQGESV
jgi:hypothetical protein